MIVNFSGRAALLIWTLILFIAADAMAETTNTLSDAEIQGRQLAQQLYEARPTENFTNSGTLIIWKKNNQRLDFVCEAIIQEKTWQVNYTVFQQSCYEELKIIHDATLGNHYFWRYRFAGGIPPLFEESTFPNIAAITNSLFNSDFAFADLGLEFFHWPQQKILPKTTNLKRGREYTLLESTNPNPSTNGYSRVLSWIDKESGGILEAEAYDFNGKLLKDFAPKSFKKVNGQWQLQEMEIRNVQTGSRTRLEFDLKP